MPIAISRHFTDDQLSWPLSIDDKIAVFADRIRGWQLDVADRLRGDPHAGFAIVALLASYFETIAKYEAGYVGDGASRRFFSAGVTSVLASHAQPPGTPIPSPVIDLMYDEIRCGLYHVSMTGPRIVVSTAPGIPMISGGPPLTVDPHQLIDVVQDHFSRYILALNKGGDTKLRRNFEARFDADSRPRPRKPAQKAERKTGPSRSTRRP